MIRDCSEVGVARSPLRHHEHYEHGSSYAGGSSFMERVAEAVASGMGSVQFVVIGSGIILAWVLVNGAAAYFSHTFHAITHGGQFDPEPWILLNLIFSGVAFYTGALVIIAQKAQTRTDKANELAAAKHRDELDEMQRKLLEAIHQLARDDCPGGTGTVIERIDALGKTIGEIHDQVVPRIPRAK